MAIERVVDTNLHDEDPEERKVEISLRPDNFDEYIGQELASSLKKWVRICVLLLDPLSRNQAI